MSVVIGIILALVILVAAFVASRSKTPAPYVPPSSTPGYVPSSPTPGHDPTSTKYLQSPVAALQKAAAAAVSAAATLQASVQQLASVRTYATFSANGRAFGVPPPSGSFNSYSVAITDSMAKIMNTVTGFSNSVSGWTYSTQIETLMGAEAKAAVTKADVTANIDSMAGSASNISTFYGTWFGSFEAHGRPTIGLLEPDALIARASGLIPSQIKALGTAMTTLATQATRLNQAAIYGPSGG